MLRRWRAQRAAQQHIKPFERLCGFAGQPVHVVEGLEQRRCAARRTELSGGQRDRFEVFCIRCATGCGTGLRHEVRVERAPDDVDVLGKLVEIHLQRRFDHGVAQFGQQRRSVCRRRGVLGVNGCAQHRSRLVCDRQPARRPGGGFGKRLLGWRDDVRGASVRAGDQIEERRAVAHAARHRKLDGMREQRIAHVRPCRYAVPGWFQADETVAGCGHTDRAAAIVRVRQRHDPRSNGGAGAAARTPRAVPGFPWVVHRAERNRFGGGVVAGLRGLCGADKMEPGGSEALHEAGVGVVGDLRNGA